ncbi:HPP family protein [Sphingomonas sp. DT-207]|uniref:HPP family protein n=1 Tax=Sphingomonas sp. DT-207 TaxID=3396167 RepID=UPI003F1BF533
MKKIHLLLAGANWRDRLLACLGAFAGIAITALVCSVAQTPDALVPFLVAPMGASAVLVFAVPSSPLAQPWPVIGGNMISAAVGLACAALLGHGPWVAGLAVGLAITAMSLLRCLHPPGGACALLPVLGAGLGPDFVLAPVGINAVALAVMGVAFHRISGHSYPHRPASLPVRPSLLAEDIDAALAEAHESFDVSREDLQALLARAEQHALERRVRRR